LTPVSTRLILSTKTRIRSDGSVEDAGRKGRIDVRSKDRARETPWITRKSEVQPYRFGGKPLHDTGVWYGTLIQGRAIMTIKAVLLVTAAALALVGCGDSSNGGGVAVVSGGTTGSTPTPSPATPAPTPASSLGADGWAATGTGTTGGDGAD
jgi:hypothetical protein